MKSTPIYYLFICTPLIALVAGAKTGALSNEFFVFFLFVYLFVYRTITDTLRLRAKGAIDRKDFTAILLPFSRVKYFKALYLP